MGDSQPGVWLRFCVGLCVVLAASGAFAQPTTQEPKRTSEVREPKDPARSLIDVMGKPVSYMKATEGYLATPAGKGPFPALVVIHEWWGLNPQIKGEADMLARKGYVALAVDLYHGTVATTPDQARAAMQKVVPDSALANLNAAVAFLQADPSVKKDRIGVIGWCFGGGQALNLALHNPNLAAAVIYYGHLETDPRVLKQIRCPVLGQFGGADPSIPVAQVKAFEMGLKQARVTNEVYIYPGAGHAFANPTGTRFNREAAGAAWKRTAAFLEKYLKR